MLFLYISAVDVQYMTEDHIWHVAWPRYCFGRWHQHTKCYKNMLKFIIVSQYMKT